MDGFEPDVVIFVFVPIEQDDIDNGRLVCEVGVAPVRPAEFVIFRIFQHTARTQR